MKNPFGIECPYFYGDYYRGRNNEECRLIADTLGKLVWEKSLCENCPVPEIRRANACTSMVLTPRINKGFLVFKKRVTVTAFCVKSNENVKSPEIGCGICHKLPDVFTK